MGYSPPAVGDPPVGDPPVGYSSEPDSADSPVGLSPVGDPPVGDPPVGYSSEPEHPPHTHGQHTGAALMQSIPNNR